MGVHCTELEQVLAQFTRQRHLFTLTQNGTIRFRDIQHIAEEWTGKHFSLRTTGTSQTDTGLLRLLDASPPRYRPLLAATSERSYSVFDLLDLEGLAKAGHAPH